MIIGLSGYAQVGKDTVASYLIDKYGYRRVAFADPIREALYKLDPKIRIDEMVGASLANAVDHMGWEEVKKLSSDARELLQRMGTEVGRDIFGSDFWVNQAFKNVGSDDKVVFTDTRFLNEADHIRSYCGQVWRINKLGHGPVNGHYSETALDQYQFDWTIPNYGTKEDLHLIIDEIMKS
jgi:tetrahydromethanopterin S-methyltransferase subunit G